MIGLIMKGMSLLGIPEGVGKILAVLLIIGTIAGALFTGYKLYDNMSKDLIAANIRATKAETVAKKNQEALETVKEQSQKNIDLIVNVSNNLTDVREKLDEQTEVFRKHDWDYLFQNKPNLMLNKFNTGTRQLFSDLEANSGSPNSSN